LRLEEILERALRLVKPSEDEEARLKIVADKAIQLAEDEGSKLKGMIRVSLEGSAAKNTWIRGRAEADIFIHFDPSIPRDEMEKMIIDLGFKVIERLGGEPRLMYADHPYVEGLINGVTVDLVACYEVEPPNWISATDRTPYHTKYVLEKLEPGQEDEVRLLKGFMLGCGVYGAEIKVKGFSGYLTELLVINYGDFMNVIESASRWKPPIVIDPEKHYRSIKEVVEMFHDQPLIMIDPVDRGRNAAAAVSRTRLSEFIIASKLFLRNPSIKLFMISERRPKIRVFRRLSKDRDFLHIILRLMREKPPDVIWGELKRSEEGVKRALRRLGFEVYQSSSWTDESKLAIMLFELNSLNLPRYMLHQGPPAHLENSIDFIEKWLGEAIGPWIYEDRLYVLRRRDEVRAVRLLRDELSRGRVSIAKGLSKEFSKAVIGGGIERLIKLGRKRGDILRFIEDFLDARPRFLWME